MMKRLIFLILITSCLFTFSFLVMVSESFSVTLTQFTPSQGTNWQPSWSPDGTMIAYVSSKNIVNSYEDGSQDIYIMPITGGTPKKLTNYDGVDGYKPKYSPDGKKILYSTKMNSEGLGIWTIPSTGGSPTKIYDSFANDYWASWSPDEKNIVFYSDQTKPTLLWIVSSEGKSLRQLTSGYEYYVADWSPDGSKIITHSFRTGNHDLWSISTSDGSATQLTNTAWNEHYATYSPDGKWLAFGADKDGKGNLWVMPSTGGEQILIADNLGSDGVSPTWSPDGTRIALNS